MDKATLEEKDSQGQAEVLETHLFTHSNYRITNMKATVYTQRTWYSPENRTYINCTANRSLAFITVPETSKTKAKQTNKKTPQNFDDLSSP